MHVLDCIFTEDPNPEPIGSIDPELGQELLSLLRTRSFKVADGALHASRILAEAEIAVSELLELASDPEAPMLGRAAAALTLITADAKVKPANDRLRPFLEAARTEPQLTNQEFRQAGIGVAAPGRVLAWSTVQGGLGAPEHDRVEAGNNMSAATASAAPAENGG